MTPRGGILLLVLFACGEDTAQTLTTPEWQGIPIGSPCTGVGECARSPGVVERNGSGGATCSTIPGGSADVSLAEICDLLDNDCNGLVDDLIEGRCDRCFGLDEDACALCDDADPRGVFDRCTQRTCGDCDRLASPGANGWICGCNATSDCPCNFVCGELDLGDGVRVAGCAPP